MDVDVVVLGTGLSQSITAAALSKAGFSVAHVDTNSYYGGDEASLTLDEVTAWANSHCANSDVASPFARSQRAKFSSISRSSSSLTQSRHYSLSLAPTIIPSTGPLIDALISSGVSRYGGFKLLEKIAIYDAPGSVKAVPGSKEDVFKSKELSLMDKRRLMRFLMFASGDFDSKKELEGKADMPFVNFLHDAFSLDNRSASAIAYALAFCISPSDPTLPALQRIQQYLRSTGRYGPSPFLIGHYGGLGEIAQGFCRTAAVNGTTYILGRQVVSLEQSESDTIHEGTKFKIELEDLPEQLTCCVVVASPDYLTSQYLPGMIAEPSNFNHQPVIHNDYPMARCVAIVDRPISFIESQETAMEPSAGEDTCAEKGESSYSDTDVDTALLVFPPGSLPEGSSTVAVNVLVTGEGSMSTPRGKWVLYISMPLLANTTRSAEQLLRPYLDATLTLTRQQDSITIQPLFTMFYVQHANPTSKSSLGTSSPVIMAPPSSHRLPEHADSATIHAENMFWKAVNTLKASGRRPRQRRGKEEGSAEDWTDIDSFWPPWDVMDDPSDD